MGAVMKITRAQLRHLVREELQSNGPGVGQNDYETGVELDGAVDEITAVARKRAARLGMEFSEFWSLVLKELNQVE